MNRTMQGVVMTAAQLRRELIETGADPFEIAALALEQVNRLQMELSAMRSERERVDVDRLPEGCGRGCGRVIRLQRDREGRRLSGCGA